jgi:hypothetical protein
MSLLENISSNLEETFKLHQHVNEAGLQGDLFALQEWQCQRLRLTYDFLFQQSKFQPAMMFFLEELYGPQTYQGRDQELSQIIPKMAKLLPEKAMLSLAKAMELNHLSLTLDIELLKHLKHIPLNRHSYCLAYATCDNRSEREHQITLIEELSIDLNRVTQIKGISLLIKMSKKPAKIAGFLTLHNFLSKGYNAFKHIGDIESFIRPIVTQERIILSELFKGNMPIEEDI